MAKYLITGFSGFVSRHFLDYLDNRKERVSVLGIDIHEPEFGYKNYDFIECSFSKIDLLDKGQVDNVLYEFQPNYILHLASFSSVAFSWKNPVSSFANNTNIFLNLIDQIRNMGIQCRVLSVGSSEEYGNVDAHQIPLVEHQQLYPLSPYAVARVSQEMISKVYVDGYDQDIVLTRSFNHIGPGQKDIFVVSSFARQLVTIKKYQKEPVLITGDLTIVRDFLDVRDVVAAYYGLLHTGVKGEVYNVCSGNGISLHTLVNTMCAFLDIEIDLKTNPALIRPNDNRVIIGSNKKITDLLNWIPEYSIEKSVQDILNYWQTIV